MGAIRAIILLTKEIALTDTSIELRKFFIKDFREQEINNVRKIDAGILFYCKAQKVELRLSVVSIFETPAVGQKDKSGCVDWYFPAPLT